MRTKEFIKRVEELGFGYEKAEEVYFIYDNEGTEYAAVCHTTPNQISNTERAWDWLDKDVQEKLFDLLIEYARTPIEEREEEKKFYLRYKWINADYNYLNYDCRLDVYGLDRILSFNWIKGKFTLEEIEDIKEKYDTKLEDFEIVEVEK
nr:MAG TPA: hypothetical protein [Caudoviricetes sp.]